MAKYYETVIAACCFWLGAFFQDKEQQIQQQHWLEKMAQPMLTIQKK